MPEEQKIEDINLDNVLNTGENSNRILSSDTNIEDENKDLTPEQIQAKADADKAAEEASKSSDDDANKGLTPEQIAAVQEENSNSLKTLLSTFMDESTLTDDNKSIRTQLLEKHKGTSFDAEGNIIDAQGNTVASFEDLLKYSTEKDKVILDDKGNQIDTEGKIVKTNVELAIENTVVNKLHSESDYEFLNDDDTVKIYSDDEKGIKDFTNDVSAQRFEEWKSEFFSQTPELAEITKHILSGKSIDTYNSAIDYSKLDVIDMSKDDKLKYIRRSYEIAGLSEERINGLVQLFVDSNTVDTEITKALPALQANEEAARNQRDVDYQTTIDTRNIATEKYWNDVETTVNKGTFNDISIPEKDKVGFFDYLSSVVDDKGNSKEMLDTNKETLEQKLQIKYLRFKGYDLSELVNTKVRTQKVQSLKELIKKSAALKDTPINDANKGTTSREVDVTINSLLG